MLHDIYNKIFKEDRFTITDNIIVLGSRTSKDTYLHKIYNFLNENYYYNSNFKWRYSLDLLKYFIDDSIVVIFYLPNKIDGNISGIIVGKPIYVMHDDTHLEFPVVTKSIDINFLCVKKCYRGLRICNFIKNILMKSVLEDEHEINSALFTIGSQMGYKMYSEKDYYFRFYNDTNVNNCNFISEQMSSICIDSKPCELNENLGISIRSYFNINVDNNLLKYINDCLYDNNRRRFSIFQTFNLIELQKIMSCSSFLKVFLLCDNRIIGFILLYKLDLHYNNVTLNNMFVYNYFTNGIEEKYLWKCLDRLCFANNIDMITSCFKHSEYFYKSRLRLKFYEMNLGLKHINGDNNGLVTI